MRHHNVLLVEESVRWNIQQLCTGLSYGLDQAAIRFIILSLIIILAKIINPVKCDASLLRFNFNRVVAGCGACKTKAVNITILYKLLKKVLWSCHMHLSNMHK